MTGAQLRMARAALKLGVRELAARAMVSPNTITRIEADGVANSSTISAVRAVLEAEGVTFISMDDGRDGVQIKSAGGGTVRAAAGASGKRA